MKKIIFLIIIICLEIILNNSLKAQWVALPCSNINYLNSIYFFDSNNGFAAGYGVILKTSNAGTTWTSYNNFNYFFTSVFFTDINNGYVVGSDGLILKTTNAGNNWSQLTSGTNFFLSSVFFTDANTGYVVGDFGTLLKTVNSGNNWVPISSGTNDSLAKIVFINSNTGYAVGKLGTILKTTNEGNTWTKMISGTSLTLKSVYFTDANTGYAVGDSSIILKTTNAGNSWFRLTNTSYIPFTSVHFTDLNNGYIVGDFGTILKTKDAGMTWKKLIISSYSLFNSIFFTDSNIGYIVNNGGEIFKTTSGGVESLIITELPTNKNICLGINDSLVISATGSGIIHYKWQHNNLDIPDSDSDTLIINNATYSDTGNYRCIVWDDWNTINSNYSRINIIYLTVNAGFDIKICRGQNTTLNANGYSNYPLFSGTLNYNWSPNNALSSVNIHNPVASPISTTTYTVGITDQLGCTKSDEVIITVKNPYENEEICIVTVDTSTWKNRLTWNKTLFEGTDHFNLYKEVSTNIYNWIGSIPFDSISSFIDVSSIPESHADKYKISVVDTCGNESEKSFFHKTMNLIVSGYGTTMGLSWTAYVDESGLFIPSRYYIYRGKSPETMTIHDSISGSFTSYNDLNIHEKFYYMIGLKKENSCNSDKNNIFSISFSNKKDNNGLFGINEIESQKEEIKVFPNPFSDKTTISIKNANHLINNLKIFNSTGNEILNYQNINSNSFILNRCSLKSGLYYIEINYENYRNFKKILLIF